MWKIRDKRYRKRRLGNWMWNSRDLLFPLQRLVGILRKLARKSKQRTSLMCQVSFPCPKPIKILFLKEIEQFLKEFWRKRMNFSCFSKNFGEKVRIFVVFQKIFGKRIEKKTWRQELSLFHSTSIANSRRTTQDQKRRKSLFGCPRSQLRARNPRSIPKAWMFLNFVRFSQLE